MGHFGLLFALKKCVLIKKSVVLTDFQTDCQTDGQNWYIVVPLTENWEKIMNMNSPSSQLHCRRTSSPLNVLPQQPKRGEAHSLRIKKVESHLSNSDRYTALIFIRMHNFPLSLKWFIFSKSYVANDNLGQTLFLPLLSLLLCFFQKKYSEIWGWVILTKRTLTKNGVHVGLSALISCYLRVEGANWRK